MSEVTTLPVFSLSVYQKQAARTSGLAKMQNGKLCPPYTGGKFSGQAAHRLYVAGLGLVGETGEFMDLLKKVLGHGHEYDSALFVKELGDILWYVSEIISSLGGTLTEHESFDVLQTRAATEFGNWKVTPVPFLFDEERGKLLSLVTNMVHYASNVQTLIHLVTVVGKDGIPISFLDEFTRIFLMLWFKLVDTLSLSSEAVAMANLAKLQKRYPEGFSTSDSVDRIV